jgi:hypothetical protein
MAESPVAARIGGRWLGESQESVARARLRRIAVRVRPRRERRARRVAGCVWEVARGCSQE